jgi:Flp pilus assembly pilin Flp
MVRKFRDFLKDESATAAIEYIILAASIAVAIITAVKPPSLACRTCGRPMRFVTATAKFGRHPELRTYECGQCKETVVEEWRPRESGRRTMPNSRQGARTLAEGLMVLRKKWGIRNLDIVLIFGQTQNPTLRVDGRPKASPFYRFQPLPGASAGSVNALSM